MAIILQSFLIFLAFSVDVSNGDGAVVQMTELTEARPIGTRVCKGQTCETQVVLKERNNDPIDNICYRICQENTKTLYHKICDCKKFPVDTSKIPCTTPYFENALCKWSTDACTNKNYCAWRKNKALSIIRSQNISSCDCKLKEKKLKKPCFWKASEESLCSLLKENNLVEADYQCVCDTTQVEPDPGENNACIYTENRPAQLKPWRTKRLYASSTAVSCNYPGVVGLFFDLGHEDFKVNISCTATLLDAETLLFDTQCKNLMADPMYALVDSYDTRTLKSSHYQVKMDTIKPLDPHYGGNSLYTAKLNKRVVFGDNKCAQPACVPNRRIPAHYVNLEDCRVLGYGDNTNDVFVGPSAARLQQVRVRVDKASVTKDLLEVSRLDGVKNTACMRDFSAPVVCSHKYTDEWITVGVHRYAGPVCSGESRSNVYEIVNLLGESQGNKYFIRLKPYHPVPRTALDI